MLIKGWEYIFSTFIKLKEGATMKASGIGGQAVLEGIMMRNKDKYSVAVRKMHQKEVALQNCHSFVV